MPKKSTKAATKPRTVRIKIEPEIDREGNLVAVHAVPGEPEHTYIEIPVNEPVEEDVLSPEDPHAEARAHFRQLHGKAIQDRSEQAEEGYARRGTPKPWDWEVLEFRLLGRQIELEVSTYLGGQLQLGALRRPEAILLKSILLEEGKAIAEAFLRRNE